MKNTPERLKALDNMVLAVKFFNEHCNDTGYQVEREIYDDHSPGRYRISVDHRPEPLTQLSNQGGHYESAH